MIVLEELTSRGWERLMRHESIDAAIAQRDRLSDRWGMKKSQLRVVVITKDIVA